MSAADLMEDRSLFISSCNRRELARRKPSRRVPWTRIALFVLVLAVAFAAVLAARGGL